MTSTATKIPQVAWRRSVRAFNRGLGQLETTLRTGATRRSATRRCSSSEPPLGEHAPLPARRRALRRRVPLESALPVTSARPRSPSGSRAAASRTAPRATPRFTGRPRGTRSRASADRSGIASFASRRSTPLSARPIPRSCAVCARRSGRSGMRPVAHRCSRTSSARSGSARSARRFPKRALLFVRRDLGDNAQSLLAARKRIHGSYATWWSVEPPRIDQLRSLPPHEQVVEQIRAVEAVIQADRDVLGPERFLELRYEDVCDDPRQALREVADFAGAGGVALLPRREVPARFDRPAPPPLEPELRAALADYLRTTSPA